MRICTLQLRLLWFFRFHWCFSCLHRNTCGMQLSQTLSPSRHPFTFSEHWKFCSRVYAWSVIYCSLVSRRQVQHPTSAMEPNDMQFMSWEFQVHFDSVVLRQLCVELPSLARTLKNISKPSRSFDSTAAIFKLHNNEPAKCFSVLGNVQQRLEKSLCSGTFWWVYRYGSLRLLLLGL